jgi:cytochrome c556
MSRRLVVTATVLSLGLGIAVAHETHSKAEQANAYRHGLYGAIAWNFGPLGGMAQGKVPFDKAEAATRAARVAALAEMLPEAFPEGSAIKGQSEAKPAIWEHRAEFDALLKKFIMKTAALSDGAKTADLEKLKTLVSDTRAVCKECHDKFKED